MCSQRDCFFWIVVACNYSLGGSAAVSLRCWQKMPFASEVVHLASGKRVHNLAKRETFCLVPSLGQAFNHVGSSDVEIHTLHIQSSSSEKKKKRKDINPPHFMKVQLDRSIRRVCCTFPPTFWRSKSESSKSLSLCIINATRVKEVAKSMPHIPIFTWQQQKHTYPLHHYKSEHVKWVLLNAFNNTYVFGAF